MHIEGGFSKAYTTYGVSKFYTTQANTYSNPHKYDIERLLRKKLSKNNLWINKQSKILDLACGSGQITIPLISYGYKYIKGTDPYTVELYKKQTNQQCDCYSFMDIFNGCYGEEKFDCIICSYALHLVKESLLHDFCNKLSEMAKIFIVISPHKFPIIKETFGWEQIQAKYLKVIILFKTNKKINKIFNNSNNYQTVNKVKKNDKQIIEFNKTINNFQIFSDNLSQLLLYYFIYKQQLKILEESRIIKQIKFQPIIKQQIKTMLDWQGLLKFSLQHSDGTKQSNYKQLSQDDKIFLQNALDSYCNQQLHRLQNIISVLTETENQHQQDHIELLQQLQQLLDSLDKGGLLYKLNGHIPLLHIVFFHKINSNRILALQILSAANQNDAFVQNQSINIGALQLMEVIQKQNDVKVKENMMSTISSIIRGENLQAKRIFIKIGGLELIKLLLSTNPTPRLAFKINTLLRDLLYYDNYLHQTYKDLSSFSNTTGITTKKDNQDLKFDVNKQKIQNNFLSDNAKYKGMIQKFIDSNQSIKKQYSKWLSQQEKNQQ